MNRTSKSYEQDKPRGITRSISPGVPCPETMLVVLMSNGSYLLVGYPQAGPTALVVRDDAGPLRQALAAAFGPGHSAETGVSRNGTGTNTGTNKHTSSSTALSVAPGSEPKHFTEVHP